MEDRTISLQRVQPLTPEYRGAGHEVTLFSALRVWAIISFNGTDSFFK